MSMARVCACVRSSKNERTNERASESDETMDGSWGRMMLLKPRSLSVGSSLSASLPPSPARPRARPHSFPFIFFEVHTFLLAPFSPLPSLPRATLLIDYSDRGISFAGAF